MFGKPLSQEVLARWLNITQGHVSRLENGKAEQNIEFLTAYAAALHLPANKLWFALPGHRMRAQADEIVEDAIVEAANESARLLSWTESGAIGDLTIEQMVEEIQWASRNYLRVPTPPLFNRIRLLRNRIFDLIPTCRRPSRMAELYAAAGWCLSLLGWISTDIGAAHAAKSHLRAAWACADNAELDELKAWVRACQHTVSFWDGDFEQAAKNAQDGLQYAQTGTSKLFLSSALALDIARTGNVESSTSALTTAQRNAESFAVGSDFLGGPFTCSVARAAGFWSDVHLATGNAQPALAQAIEAVRLFERAEPATRNLGSERMARCQVVKAHLTLGELDGAREALKPILLTDPDNRVRPLLRRVSEIAELAIALPIGKDKRVVELGEAIREFKTSSRIEALEARSSEDM
ncbi:hypothetical protein Acsp05_13410 [Actinokineospora sp. NBRC 105648]|nr:hypothetical protein Acsp05_13410 [Actinokineospora sp. NBRC 105648]